MSTSQSLRTNPARIALIAAAAVAILSIGYAAMHGGDQGAAESGAPGGVEQAQQGQDIAALIEELRATLAENPDDEAGWAQLASAYYQSGQFGEAADAYVKASALNPTLARYHSARGEALALASEESFPAEATAALRRAIALDPQDPRARYFLAVEKDMSGDHPGALDDWIALLEDSPPGAPWEPDLRRLIDQVASANDIDVAGRVPAPGNGTPEAMPQGQQDAMLSAE